MKIMFLAAGSAPDWYEVDGDVVTAHFGDESLAYNFSDMPNGAIIQSVEPIGGFIPVRDAFRDAGGELSLVLCQRVGPGHWSESDWLDASEYDPDAVYVKLSRNAQYSGRAVAYTRQGAVELEVPDE